MDQLLVQQNCRRILDRIHTVHLRTIANSQGPVFYISDAYPGVWMEHIYDSLVWADLSGDTSIPRNYIKLFLDNQKPDGQLPCYVWHHKVGYSQLQECISFATLCLETWQLDPDPEFLRQIYEGCQRWDAWLCRNRMHGGHGLVEMYCGYDTGHDNSIRLHGMKYPGNVSENAEDFPTDCPVAPLLAPDINANFCANRFALAQMATHLNLPDEAAAWQKKAESVLEKLFEICYDPEDQFFYDMDRHGVMRKIRNISIANIFAEKILDPGLVTTIFNRYFRSSAEFGTPFPYASVSVSTPGFEKNAPGNSWGYYSQGLTMLRTLRWMKHYGFEQELHHNMERWLHAWNHASRPFGQELDPFTGEASECSPWYSATMLFYLASARELELFHDFS